VCARDAAQRLVFLLRPRMILAAHEAHRETVAARRFA
jgi:hypothetical protein